jgi:hypothetical protein
VIEAEQEPLVRDDLKALDTELARLDRLIEAEMWRLRARYELSRDEFHGLYITDERVEALLRDVPVATVSRPEPPDVSVARRHDRRSRWGRLARALDLSDLERDLVLVCLAADLDPKYETLYAYLNNDVARPRPTPELLVRLLAGDRTSRTGLRALLLPDAKLLSSGLIETLSADHQQARGRRGMRVAAPLVDWLRGLPYVDERLTEVARFRTPEAGIPDAALPAAARLRLVGLAERLRRDTSLPPVVITATTAAEAALVAEDLIARAGRGALILNLGALRTAPAAAELVASARLAQRILDLAVLAAPLDTWMEPDGRPAESGTLRALVSGCSPVVLAGSHASRVVELVGDMPSIGVTLPESSPTERAAAWHSALRGITAAVDGDWSTGLVSALADRFGFGIDRIFRAAAAVREAVRLEGGGTCTPDQVFAAAREMSEHGAGGTTRLCTTSFTWDDLVLPTGPKEQLCDLIHAIERRSQVLDRWGFARRIGGARGIKAMFAGPSGTGKTMAAAIVAQRLHLDLYRIELANVVSKYIGETEKNLDRAFEAARRANAVLFIDEADALLGKRSQVKDAHDRYANVEIAYLLQKMEDHDGIVIVATNLAQNIDDAFSRRMQFVIEFPMPDVVGRERLWRGLIPESAPLASDVDFTFLARQFEMAGGDIRNVVLDAAYRAAQNGGEISMGHLLRAVARQYAKRGRVPTMADFREHYGLLSSEPAPGGPV